MIDSFRTCHTLFLLNCELRKYYRSHGEQSNSSRMSSWSICEVPRRAGFTLSIVLGFPTSCGPTRCWLNYYKPCPRMTLQMPSKMLQPHVKNHSGMTGKAIRFSDAVSCVFSVLYFAVPQLKKTSLIARSVTHNPET